MVWVYFACSYLIGNLMFGFLMTRLFYHEDIRNLGSGNVGARNAGRLYGKKAFLFTFLGDALKGALVVVAGRYLHFSDPVQLIGLALVIIGHLKPVFLKFNGGKGISTFVGGMVAFQPLLIPVAIPIFLILYLFFRSLTLAGLSAFLMIPVFLVIKQYQWESFLLVIVIILMIFIAQKDDIKERLLKK
ncbi:glycerol-3-phosphate acyltransferase [Neobacillus dielmonensis]|uniref:glycerol-3-phosphate acyltransferase n=1 Tax=Neobacillus dielmonensis TaxID=1347369 RepID=UPI0005A9179B|nr:glycerol-3-phosphate acyltransferase [Neobacillus dielmonensis]